MPATFQCKLCRLHKPEADKAPPWEKRPGLTIDMGRCVDCDRLAHRWNGKLFGSSPVQPDVQKLSKRARQAAKRM